MIFNDFLKTTFFCYRLNKLLNIQITKMLLQNLRELSFSCCFY